MTKAMGAAVVTEAVVGAAPVTIWLMAVALVTPVRLTVPLSVGLVESGVSVCMLAGVSVTGHSAAG